MLNTAVSPRGRQTVAEAGDVFAQGSDANAYIEGLYFEDRRIRIFLPGGPTGKDKRRRG